MKKGLNRKDFIFEKKKGETLTKVPGQINGLDFLISNLEDCEVYLMDHTAQIFVDDCKNCTIYIGPVESSLFIRECENLKISAACSQYRVSDSKNIDSCVFSLTDPTLENCKNVRFAPYNFAYPSQREHFEKAKLDPTQNHWSQVFDFNENKADPNWSILPPAEYPGPVQKAVDDMPEPENPVEVPEQYGGTLKGPILIGSQEQGGTQDEGGMMAFGIQTGAEEAQQHFEVEEGQEEVQEAHDQYQNQAQYAQPVGGDGYDDFFGSQPATHGGSTAQYDVTSQATYGTSAYGGMGAGLDADYDPEEEERQEKLRRKEQERNRILDEKSRAERDAKQERIANAARDLAKWHAEREQNIEKRKQINRQNQQIQNEASTEDEYKNSWDKIVGNVATKEGEYPGTKDVTRFRQALINKKTDVAKGINTDIGKF